MTSSMPWISIVVGVVVIVFLAGAAAPVSHAQVNFSSPPAYAGTGTQFVADFNLDGKPDILTASGMLNLGVGDGTFTSGPPVTGQPLAVADFNGDGKSDILEQSTGTLLVLLGNGDGTFEPPISTPSGASLTAVIAGDLNWTPDAEGEYPVPQNQAPFAPSTTRDLSHEEVLLTTIASFESTFLRL